MEPPKKFARLFRMTFNFQLFTEFMAIYTGQNKHLGGTEKKSHRQLFFYGLVEKNVLVTGANGQLGSELRERQQRSNNPFRFIYTDFDELDITDAAQVLDFVERGGIRYIINCAAYTNVEKAESEAEEVALINVSGVEHLARAARKYGCRMLHISTDFVFDGQSSTPYTETDRPNPLSVYGKTKWKGEEVLQACADEWIILRTSWLYSSYGNNFVKTMLRLMNEREEIAVVSDQIGRPTYAADLAEMIIHILEYSEANEWKTGIYHFSNEGATSWFGFAREIRKQAGLLRCEVVPITTSAYGAIADRPAYSIMDLSKIRSVFKVEIPAWEEALSRCLKKLKG